MLKEKKAKIIDELAEDISRSTTIIATDYRGLSAKQMAELRNTLTKTGAQYHVVKNTLARSAANKAGKRQATDIVEGPTALAFSYDEKINLAKEITRYIKSTELSLRIRGGLLGERILTPDEVTSLANLPTKEVIISQLIAQLQTPIRGLHNAVTFPLRGLLTVLKGKTQKFDE